MDNIPTSSGFHSTREIWRTPPLDFFTNDDVQRCSLTCRFDRSESQQEQSVMVQSGERAGNCAAAN
jgi:hypothetical protein